MSTVLNFIGQPIGTVYDAGNPFQYNGRGDGVADDTVALQTALDSGRGVFIPNGTWRITAPLELDDDTTIVFESRAAIIKGNLTTALLRGRNGATERRHNIQIYNGQIDNTSAANAGSIGIDLLSASSTKVYGTYIHRVATGVRIGGSSSQGAFYNDFFGVDILTTDVCAELGTLANHNNFFGGRASDCAIGFRLNDNSGNLFDGVATEQCSAFCYDVAPTVASQYTKIFPGRMEGGGVGVRVGTLATATHISAPTYIAMATNVINNAFDTVGLSDTELLLRNIQNGGTQTSIRAYAKVTSVIDFPLIGAGATNDQTVAVAALTGVAVTDVVAVTPPSTLAAGLLCTAIPGVNQVTVRMANITAAGIDPASATFTITVWKHN